MFIKWVEGSDGEVIAREDASDGEFILRAGGGIWYRGAYGGDDCFVNIDVNAFRQSAAALHRYNRDIVGVRDEEAQMVVVHRFAEDLREVGALPGPPEAFWPLMVEQAEHGLL